MCTPYFYKSAEVSEQHKGQIWWTKNVLGLNVQSDIINQLLKYFIKYFFIILLSNDLII